jgi:AcrR family transcriptional regulator
VGISQGAVFKHFSSKEAIWMAVLDWATETLMTRLQAAADEAPIEATPTGLSALRAVFMAHVNFVIEQPGVPRMIFHELQRPDESAVKQSVRKLLQRYRQLLLNLLQQALAQKALRPDIDLQAAAVLFIGSVQGLVMQALISGDVAAMAVQAPGVFAIVQRGLQNRSID